MNKETYDKIKADFFGGRTMKAECGITKILRELRNEMFANEEFSHDFLDPRIIKYTDGEIVFGIVFNRRVSVEFKPELESYGFKFDGTQWVLDLTVTVVERLMAA